MSETNQKETIGEISKLRGSRTQREALQKIDKQTSAQSAFADVEATLFWIMAAELALYGLSAFTLFALAKLVEDDPAPDELEVEKRLPVRRPELAPKTTTRGDAIDDTHSERKTTRDDTSDGLRRLREALKLIAFERPPGHFKVDLRPDYLIIRAMESKRGDEYTTHSVRAKLSLLDDAMKMQPEDFRERLEKFLRENGFEL